MSCWKGIARGWVRKLFCRLLVLKLWGAVRQYVEHWKPPWSAKVPTVPDIVLQPQLGKLTMWLEQPALLRRALGLFSEEKKPKCFNVVGCTVSLHKHLQKLVYNRTPWLFLLRHPACVPSEDGENRLQMFSPPPPLERIVFKRKLEVERGKKFWVEMVLVFSNFKWVTKSAA